MYVMFLCLVFTTVWYIPDSAGAYAHAHFMDIGSVVQIPTISHFSHHITLQPFTLFYATRHYISTCVGCNAFRYNTERRISNLGSRELQLSRLGSFWLISRLVNVLGRILGRIFTKLDMMNGHGSVTMPIDGRHGPVITGVMVGSYLTYFHLSPVVENWAVHKSSPAVPVLGSSSSCVPWCEPHRIPFPFYCSPPCCFWSAPFPFPIWCPPQCPLLPCSLRSICPMYFHRLCCICMLSFSMCASSLTSLLVITTGQ